jgi:hypothetical protein
MKEKGQTLVIVAIILVVLLGMLAVIIDGGYAYSNRRSAQNAADAAALAGASELCKGNPDSTAISVASNQAGKNNAVADPYNGDIFVVDKTITVNTHITFNTFFASVIGVPSMTVDAVAIAGCRKACEANSVLPIAWSCSPPAGEDPQDYCTKQFGPDNIYVVMDTKKLSEGDFICQDPPAGSDDPGIPGDPSNPPVPAPIPGQLDCDINDDGSNDVFAGGDRSWLDLDGGGGGGVADWVENGFPDPLYEHTWFNGQDGVADNVFQAIDTYRIDKLSVLPVFDQYCPGAPYNLTDTCNINGMWHDNPPNEFQDTYIGDQNGYFHIIDFSAFIVTCVAAPPGHDDCPGKNAVIAANACERPNEPEGCIGTGEANQLKSVEGYFVEGTPPGLSGDCGECDDSSICTVYLQD